MRCSPKLCIGLLIVGIGGAALFAYAGNVKAASLLPFLPILACPLMCVVMMMFGHRSGDGECHTDQKKTPLPSRAHAEK